MNYYPFNIGDYAKHTKYLSMNQDLAYRRLIDLYYINEGPIAADVESIAESIGFADHIQDVSKVLSKFFLISEGFYRNERCDEVIAEYHAKAERAKGANKSRWKAKKSDSDMKSDTKSDMKSERNRIPTNNQEPITNKKKEQKKGAALPLDFSVPEFISSRTWRDWVTHRIEIKKPMTESIAKACIAQLTKFHTAGHDVDEIILNSISGGWSGLFEPSAKRGTGPPADQQKSKGRQAIELLEGLKHGMDAQGNRYGPAKADMPRLG